MNSFTEWEKLAVMSVVMVSTITWMKAVFGPERYPEYFILEESLLEDFIHRHLVYEQDGNCWVSHWLHGPTAAGGASHTGFGSRQRLGAPAIKCTEIPPKPSTTSNWPSSWPLKQLFLSPATCRTSLIPIVRKHIDHPNAKNDD